MTSPRFSGFLGPFGSAPTPSTVANLILPGGFSLAIVAAELGISVDLLSRFDTAFFHTELLFALRADPAKDYGFSHALFGFLLVLPYEAPQTPKETSRFQKPWQAVLRTVIFLFAVRAPAVALDAASRLHPPGVLSQARATARGFLSFLSAGRSLLWGDEEVGYVFGEQDASSPPEGARPAIDDAPSAARVRGPTTTSSFLTQTREKLLDCVREKLSGETRAVVHLKTFGDLVAEVDLSEDTVDVNGVLGRLKPETAPSWELVERVRECVEEQRSALEQLER